MGLINTTPEKIDIPFEPGEWVKIRALSGREMDQAADARLARSVQHMAMMGDTVKSIPRSENTAPDDSVEARRERFDPDTLIKFALKEWSYGEPLGEDPGSQLDAQTRDWLWSVIVERNTRPPALLPVGGLSLS